MGWRFKNGFKGVQEVFKYSPHYQMCFLCVQFVKRASLPSWRPISSALDVTSRSTRHVHSSASGQFLLITSDSFSKCIRLIESFLFFFLIYSRADKTLQDIVYKLVPGLFKGKVADVRAEETLRRLFFERVAFLCASRR